MTNRLSAVYLERNVFIHCFHKDHLLQQTIARSILCFVTHVMMFSFQRFLVLSMYLAYAGSAVSAANCSLCSDGSAPTNPTATVDYGDKTNITCAVVASFLSSQPSTDLNCTYAQAGLASTCGCPTSSTTKCPKICDNMAYLNRTIPPITGLIPSIQCSDANLAVTVLSATDPYCKLASAVAGQYCGCANAPPSCTPCYGNTVMANYSKTFSIMGQSISCGEWAFATAIGAISNDTGKVNETLCTAYQGAGSLYCGCPKPPSFCSICNSSQTLLVNGNFTPPNFNYTMPCGATMAGLNIQLNSNCEMVSATASALGMQSQCCVKSSSTRFLVSSNWAAGAIMFSALAFLII